MFDESHNDKKTIIARLKIRGEKFERITYWLVGQLFSWGVGEMRRKTGIGWKWMKDKMGTLSFEREKSPSCIAFFMKSCFTSFCA